MRRPILILALLIAAMGGVTADASAKAVRGLVVAPSPRPLAALAIVDGAGKPAGFATLRGHPALVNLWASWCLPCMEELPSLDRLAAAGGTVAVVAVSLDRGGAAAVRAAYQRVGIHHLPVRIDVDGRAGEAWGVPGLPTTLLVDGQGREIARFVGAAHWDAPEAQPLLAALAAGGPLSPSMAPPPAKFTGTPP